MGIDFYLYNKLSGSTALEAIVGDKIEADFIPENTVEPYIVYFDIGSFEKNLVARQSLRSIKSVHKTKDGCNSLNDAVYNLFDDTKQSLAVESSSVKIVDIKIVNHITSMYDDTNKNYFGLTDIKISYYI